MFKQFEITKVPNAGTSLQKRVDELTLQEIFASPVPPLLPKRLPKLVSCVTSKTPQIYKAVVAQSSFPPLGIYSKNLSFLYLDGQTRQLRSSCIVVGPSGSGKDVCLRGPLKFILKPRMEVDEINRKRLAEFNEVFNSCPSNAQKPKRPDDIEIQIIMSDITRASLFQRMADAHGAPIYVKMNELEMWDKIEEASVCKNNFTILKLADDEENTVGSDRVGTASVCVTGNLFLNWNANSTPSKLSKYFQYVLNDGPISRITFGTTPPYEVESEIPTFGPYDEKYLQALLPFIENLRQASGTIVCKKALQMIKKLKRELDDFLVLSQDEVLDNLSHRALVHAFRKACLIYAANGMKWEPAIEGFCRWSLLYDLWLKMKLFADAIKEDSQKVKFSKRGPKNLLDELTNSEKRTFTFNELVDLRRRLGMSEKGTSSLLSKWKQRGYITEINNGSYEYERVK